MTLRRFLTLSLMILFVVLAGCNDEECVCPHVQKAADVVFVDWLCCGGASECGLENPDFGAIGRVRNIGDRPAYDVIIDVRPCSTCETS